MKLPSNTIHHLLLVISSTILIQLCPLSLANSSSSPIITSINQSFKPHLSSQEIAQSIRRKIHESFVQQQQEAKVEIDVSCSFLKDEGFENIINSLFERVETSKMNERKPEYDEQIREEQEEQLEEEEEEEEKAEIIDATKNNIITEQDDEDSSISTSPSTFLSISFEARMNRITNKGIALFFNKLISLGEGQEEEEQKQQRQKQQQQEEEEQQKEQWIESNMNNSTNATIGIDGNQTHISVGKKEKTIISHKSNKNNNNIYMESIDIGLNDIGLHGVETVPKKQHRNMMKFLHSMQKLIENPSGFVCPSILRMDHCGLGPPSCRFIGKGIVNSMQHILKRQKQKKNDIDDEDTNNEQDNTKCYRRLRELYLSGNPIGESGTTALAAALKISPRIQYGSSISVSASSTSKLDESMQQQKQQQQQQPVLDTLDISSCKVGDIGAEALSLAMVHNPGCVKQLILSNNKITNRGAIALAKALRVSQQKMMTSNEGQKKKENVLCYAIDTLDLSNNVDIDDEGATALFDAVACGSIRNLLLRSCSIHSEGVSSLSNIFTQIIESDDHHNTVKEYNIDISGNKIGSKKLKKKTGYSEKMMKNVNTIGQKGFGFLKSGLKEIVDFGTSSLSAVSSLESDDEAEDEDEDLIGSDQNQISDTCGAIALYDSFIECMEQVESGNRHDDDVSNSKEKHGENKIRILLGMRMCNFDDAALDALAAIKIQMRRDFASKDVFISFDCAMNQEIDDGRIKALKEIGGSHHKILEEMAERHVEAIELRRRALEAKDAEAQLNEFSFGDSEDYDDYDGYGQSDYDY